MCIAILTKPGARLDEETFKRCWNINDDGAGLAYSNGKEMVIVKELSHYKRFWRLYNKHRDAYPDVPMLVHFRIRTHGKTDLTSTQPIQINKHLAYIHNGVMHRTRVDTEVSDTVVFKRDVLKHMPNGFYMRAPFQILISNFIGEFNKLVFLDVNNRWVIFNEKKGYWENDIWYSNDGFKKKWSQTQSGIQNVYHGGNSTHRTQGSENREHERHRKLFAHCPTRLLAPLNPPPPPAMEYNLGDTEERKSSPDGKWKYRCDFCDSTFLIGEMAGIYQDAQMSCTNCKVKLRQQGVNPITEIRVVAVNGESEK